MSAGALRALSEADLLAAAGPIPLKQARADLAAGMAPQRSDGLPLTLVWPDATCAFPEGGLPAATCTCPARRTCRHRARSVLWLQSQPELAEAAPTGPPLTLEAIRAEAGAALFARASRALAEGLEVEAGEEAGVWMLLGNRVRLAPGEKLAAALCGCGARDLCLHRIIAGIVQVGGADEISIELKISELDPIAEEAATLLALGLDGCPPERAERLEHLAQRHVIGLPAAAEDLDGLAAQLRRYHQRSARFSAADWTRGLGRLLARLIALRSDPAPAQARLLRGVTRRAPLPAPSLDLLALGAEAFAGEESTLVRLWLCEPGGAVRSVSLGRPAGEQGPLDPEVLWRHLPLWGAEGLASLHGRALRLMRGRLSPDGVLSAGGDGTALVRGAGVPASALPDALIVSSITALQYRFSSTLPVILRGRDQGPILCVLALADPAFLAPARFDEAAQTLHAPLALAEGGGIGLRVRAGPFGDRLHAALAAPERWRARPTHLLARCWPGALGWEAAPISAWLEGGEGPVALGLSPGVSDTLAPTLVAGALPTPGPDPAREALGEALDQLEGLAIEGRATGRRAPRLLLAAERLERLHLGTAAAAIQAVAQALRRGDDAALATAWAGALAWALALDERVRLG